MAVLKAPEYFVAPSKAGVNAPLQVQALLPVSTDSTQANVEPGQIRQLARFKGQTYGSACSVFVFASTDAVSSPFQDTLAVIAYKQGNIWVTQSFSIPFQGLALEVAADEINVSVQNISGANRYLATASIVVAPLVRPINTALILISGVPPVNTYTLPRYCAEVKLKYFGPGSGMVLYAFPAFIAFNAPRPIDSYQDWTPLQPMLGYINFAATPGSYIEILTR